MKPRSKDHQNTLFRSLSVTLCSALFAGTLLGLPSIANAKERATDAQIEAAVESDLYFDKSVPFNDIDVDTINGVVTLSGTAPNLLAKERAAMIAETILGVRSVVNNISVSAVERTDADIRRDVQTALAVDPATDSYEITNTVKDGVVKLEGKVDSWHEKELSANVAKGVKGVREVVNDIRVVYDVERPDTEIAVDVRSALQNDVWVDASFIASEVNDGKVTLSGSVGSAAEKRRARSDAWVAGVRAVDDSNLTVEPWAAERMKRTHTELTRSDTEIRQAVTDALLLDPRVFSFRPTVTVHNGAVTLTGTVDNLKAKRAAEQDARNTTGVWRVTNLLKVRTENPTQDDRLEGNVTAALERDPYVDRFDINVSANDGTVYLSGTVDSYYEKSHAEDIASRVNGVTDVKNSVSVSYPTISHFYWPYSPAYYEPFGMYPRSFADSRIKSDAELKDSIESELFWSPFIDSDRIDVSVKDGVATLTGTVDNWTIYNYVTDNAFEGGADTVINNVAVSG